MKIQEILEIISYTTSERLGLENHKRNIKKSLEGLKRGEDKEENIINLLLSSAECLFHSKLSWEEYTPSAEVEEKELIEELGTITNPFNTLQISLDLCYVNKMYESLETILVKEIKG